MIGARSLALGLGVGVAALFSCSAANAQITTCYGRAITVLDLRAPTLVSGTALSVGAIYRFANAAPGIDVRVRINALNGGATLATIDNDAGLIANFQPELVGADARSIDFTVTFVVAGTTTPIVLDVAASGVDIDGDSGSIREYAEFSTPFAAYVLDSPTNLDVNASGPSVPTNVRFESRTSFTAPGIDETATANIVSILYTSTSTFAYRIGTLGTGATTRLTSLDFGCPNLTLPSQVTITPQDFGDAPAAYGNPAHDIVTGIRLGATNTSEPARYNSPTASGDFVRNVLKFGMPAICSSPPSATRTSRRNSPRSNSARCSSMTACAPRPSCSRPPRPTTACASARSSACVSRAARRRATASWAWTRRTSTAAG